MLDFLNYQFSLPTLILAISAGTVLLFQLIYYIAVYGRMLSFFRKKKKHKYDDTVAEGMHQGVSVVIVSNNSGDALKDGLLQILEQEYPLFEVLVVNENSTDDTEFILYVLKENYPNLTVINLGLNANKYESFKFSSAIGIRSAKYPNVLLTDVNCMPKSYNWLSQMMNPVNNNRYKNIVTGICLREDSKGLAAALERYDQAISYMNLISYTLCGNAYTSCGMNMIYNKDFLINNGGFISQYTNSCNQEDYFVHRHSSKHNTALVVDEQAFLYLPAYRNFKTFFRVKFATSLSHKALAAKDKILLALNPVTSFLYYVFAALLLILLFPWQYIVISLVIKWTVQIIYCKKCMAKLNIKKNWWAVPFMEIFFFFFNFIIRLKVLFYRKREKKIRWDK